MTWAIETGGTYCVLNRNGDVVASGCQSATEAVILIATMEP
jgi:hypothetical protein